MQSNYNSLHKQFHYLSSQFTASCYQMSFTINFEIPKTVLDSLMNLHKYQFTLGSPQRYPVLDITGKFKNQSWKI